MSLCRLTPALTFGVLYTNVMTIVSTANPVSLEEAMDIAEERAFQKRTPSFPPVNDTIAWFNNIDWADVRERCRGGINNVGLVLAVAGEKLHDFGAFLAQV